MRLNKIAFKNFAIAISFGLIACDDEFSTIESDIINPDTATNFNTVSEKFDVISYTDKLGPVQTNGLGLNMLGVYNDPNYGQTISSVLTQVNTNTLNPSFVTDIADLNEVILDSVVLSIPFFSSNVGLTEENTPLYRVDSILPRQENFRPIKLSIFENNYFLRSFDPNSDFDTPQAYFSNKSASVNEQISNSDLEFQLIDTIESLEISNEEIILTNDDDTEPVITQRIAPGIRLVWDNLNPDHSDVIDYWTNKIIKQQGEVTLSNANNFNDYFRGIYFKAEPIDNNGSMMILNFAQNGANITLHYTRPSSTVENETEQSTFSLTFNPIRVNFLENGFNINQGDDLNGDANLFIKGGEGATATIKLFDGLNTDDDNTTLNTFEAWREAFINVDEENNFESSKRLINEANLVFYVNQSEVNGEEPERLYLYNKNTGAPLIDYFEDTQNNTLPQISIPSHLGILEKQVITNKGIRYKMRITSHLNNILTNNTENVELGLAVSGNVNLEATVPQYRVQNSDEISVPISHLITPRGTVLHGNKSEDISKRLYLEIFYTCLDDENCQD